MKDGLDKDTQWRIQNVSLDSCMQAFLQVLLYTCYFFFNFFVFFRSFLSSDFTFLSTFLISSSAGKSSGFIPLFINSPLTSLLFFTCSFAMADSDLRSSLRI